MSDFPALGGIMETALYCDDLKAAEKFYTRVLGLVPIGRRDGRHVFFRCGHQVLLVFNARQTSTVSIESSGVTIPRHGARGAGHMAFRVKEAEIDAWIQRLEAHGIPIETEVTWKPGVRSVYFRDPAGNSIEIATPELWGLEREATATTSSESSPVQQQVDYYRARASEYDEWFLRRGRYDHGPESNARWMNEVEQVRQALDAFRPGRDVLELACGTGCWTERLAPQADRLTAVDASRETIEINRCKPGREGIRFVVADLFEWEPAERFDVVFFAFWLSHVPPERFDAFWALVERSLKPGGRVFFVDSRFNPESTASDHRLPDPGGTIVTRRLNDGREYKIVKVFHEPADLERRLTNLGWQVRVRITPSFFLYGAGRLIS